jgi:hypothetical protein
MPCPCPRREERERPRGRERRERKEKSGRRSGSRVYIFVSLDSGAARKKLRRSETR